MARFDDKTGERLDPEGEDPKAPKPGKAAEPKNQDAPAGKSEK